VADLKLDSPKTKNFVELLSKMGLQGTVVLVDAAIDKNLSLASRNVASVEVTTAESLNTYQVLRPSKLVITRGALEKLEARLKD